ncbi:20759_t:CDS:2, partial [Gigaspora rosea]
KIRYKKTWKDQDINAIANVIKSFKNRNANFPKYEYEWAIKLMIYHVNTNQYNINEEVIITKKITKILKQLAINYKNNLRNNDIEDNENNIEKNYSANDDERNKDFEENYSTEDDNERNDDFDEE